MKLSTFLVAPVATLLLSPLSASAQSTTAPSIAAMLAKAKAGQTVMLPAGTFAVGDLVVPSGVHLRGAGYNKTTVDAGKFSNGIIIKGGKSTVSDLAVRNAPVTGIKLEGASNAVIARVKGSLHETEKIVR